ncbi:integrase, catalytic region, zinc finger, CCHC-type containing protein [Tanacetum coccineum]
MVESPFNKFKEDKFRVMLVLEIEELLLLQREMLQPRNAAWFKGKLMLAEAQEAGQILDDKKIAFLADPDDLDAYNSNCDDLSSAKTVLMANLSSYDPEVLSEVPYSESYPNDMINQDVQEMQYSEQTHVDNFEDNEIHSEQAFWLKHSSLSETPITSHTPVRIETPIELPKVFPITALKNELRKLKGKIFVNTTVLKPNAAFALRMFKLDIEPISPWLKNNRDGHEVYIKKTIEYVVTLCGFVERARTQYPSEPLLEYACMFTKHVQELLLYASQTCPNSPKPSEKLVAVTPTNKDKRVKFAEPGSNATDVPYSSSLINDRSSRSSSSSRDTNLYTISLDDMLKTFLICLLSKALRTKSWLWHRQLSDLNFGTPNKLAKDGLARGISKLKFKKDYLCSACALGPMRMESINGKKYILVIVDDYSRFTWVKFLRSNDEVPDAIIKCIKNIQVRLNAIVCDVRIDNGTEFVNQTLHDSGPELQSMTLATSSLGLVPNPVPQQPFNPPTRNDWDRLCQPMFDEYFKPPLSVVSTVPVVVAPRAVEIDAPSSSTSSTNQQQQSSIISQGVEEPIPNALFDDPCHEPLHDVSTSQESSSNVQSSHSPLELIGKWNKDHPLANVIGNPSQPVSTRKQLKTDAMWCYFDAFLTSVEPKNFKIKKKRLCVGGKV